MLVVCSSYLRAIYIDKKRTPLGVLDMTKARTMAAMSAGYSALSLPGRMLLPQKVELCV